MAIDVAPPFIHDLLSNSNNGVVGLPVARVSLGAKARANSVFPTPALPEIAILICARYSANDMERSGK